MGRSNRTTIALVVAFSAVVAGVGLAKVQGRQAIGPAPVEVTDSAATIQAHVAGWVNAPGVVDIPEGSIVAAAVEAAGGLIPGAHADGLNLAAPVFDGDQILVPGPVDAPGSATTDGGLISLNRATSEELQQLPGVGPVLAERIIAYRESGARFTQVEDLLQVPGIGETRLASIRDLVRP